LDSLITFRPKSNSDAKEIDASVFGAEVTGPGGFVDETTAFSEETVFSEEIE